MIPNHPGRGSIDQHVIDGQPAIVAVGQRVDHHDARVGTQGCTRIIGSDRSDRELLSPNRAREGAGRHRTGGLGAIERLRGDRRGRDGQGQRRDGTGRSAIGQGVIGRQPVIETVGQGVGDRGGVGTHIGTVVGSSYGRGDHSFIGNKSRESAHGDCPCRGDGVIEFGSDGRSRDAERLGRDGRFEPRRLADGVVGRGGRVSGHGHQFVGAGIGIPEHRNGCPCHREGLAINQPIIAGSAGNRGRGSSIVGLVGDTDPHNRQGNRSDGSARGGPLRRRTILGGRRTRERVDHRHGLAVSRGGRIECRSGRHGHHIVRSNPDQYTDGRDLSHVGSVVNLRQHHGGILR